MMTSDHIPHARKVLTLNFGLQRRHLFRSGKIIGKALSVECPTFTLLHFIRVSEESHTDRISITDERLHLIHFCDVIFAFPLLLCALITSKTVSV